MTAGLGLVSANETLTDDSASAATESNAENTDNQAQEASAQVDDTAKSEVTNATDENASVNDTNDTEEFIEEEYDLGQMKELISTMNDTELNALAHYLDVNNVNGEYDDIIAILTSENYDIDALMEEINDLDDESFLTFVDILEMILNDSTTTPLDIVKNTPTSKNLVNTILEKTGTSDAVNNIVNVFTPKQNSNNLQTFVHGPDELSMIIDALDAYFNDLITFDELLDELEYWGIDPSLVEENEDGSLTIDGKVITSAQDFLDALNEDDDVADTQTNDTVVNETTNDTDDIQVEPVSDSTSEDTSDLSSSENQTTNDSTANGE